MLERALIGTPAPGESDTPRTCVVIVNYRTSSDVIDCLASLESEVLALPETEVIIVDNASGDDSVRKLRSFIDKSNYGAWASVIPHETNGGFAAGNNVAIRANLASKTPADYFFILNPDTIVRPDAVVQLTDFLTDNPEVGIVGSRLENPDGSPQFSCFRFYDVFSEFNAGCRLGVVSKLLAKHVTTPPMRDETHETEWVSGASMMVRREVFADIGLMDETFFLYYEEADFQLRAKRAGWPIWHCPDAAIVHLMGKSTGVTGEAERERRRPRYWFESRRHYFRRNYGAFHALLLDVAWLTGFSMWRIRRVIQRKPDMDPPKLWSDFLKYSLLGLRS